MWEIHDEVLTNGIEKFYIADINITDLDLDLYPYDIVIVETGIISRNFSYEVVYYDSYNNFGNQLSISRSKILLSLMEDDVAKRQYLIDRQKSEAIDRLEYLSSQLSLIDNPYDKYKIKEEVQLIVVEHDFKYNEALLNEKVRTVDFINLDVTLQDDETNMELNPLIELDNNSLITVDIGQRVNNPHKLKFNINRTSYRFYNNHDNFRIVLLKAVKNQLATAKENITVEIPTDISESDIIEKYTDFFDTSVVDLYKFSNRVYDIGAYQPKYYSFLVPNSENQWIPTLKIEKPLKGDSLQLKLKNRSEYEAFKAKTIAARDANESVFTWASHVIQVNDTDKIINKFDRLFNKQEELQTRSIVKNHIVLLIHENAEELTYDEAEKYKIELEYRDSFCFENISGLQRNITLRQHQKEGIAQLQYLYKNVSRYGGALLADDMGLGKTLQVIYFIQWYYNIEQSESPCLIVAPVTLLQNWLNEFKFFFPKNDIELVVLKSSDLPNGWVDDETIYNLNQKKIFITNYETLRKGQLSFAQIEYGVFAIDEAQRIKTPGTMITNAVKSLQSKFRIAMTGTPVENTLVDLWSIVDFIKPGLLNSAKYFHTNYQRVLEDESNLHTNIIKNLRNELGLIFIRRTKKSVASEELPKKFIYKHIEPLSSVQINYYQSVTNQFNQVEDNNPLKFIHQLKLISDSPLLLDYDVKNISIVDAINSSARLSKLIDIIKEIKSYTEKVIIFTEYHKTQLLIQNIITEKFNYKASIINGTTSTEDTATMLSRQSIIDNWQSINGFGVIIMSPIAAGVGLNVVGANHVIHYSRHWNPAKEAQATDRVYRIGQKKDVHIHYILTTHPDFDSFDIILDRLLSSKQSLANETMYPSTLISVSEIEVFKNLHNISKNGVNISYPIDSITNLSPLKFEAAIAAMFEMSGCKVFLTPTTNDKGADIISHSKDNNFIIQVKKSSKPLGITAIQEVYTAQKFMTAKRSIKYKGLVISNAILNKNAIEFKDSLLDVEYVNAKKLKEFLNLLSDEIPSETIWSIENNRLSNYEHF